MSTLLNYLNEFYQQLNTRELALIIWSIIGIVWILRNKSTYGSILDIFKAFRPLIGYFIFQLSYLVLCIYLLAQVGLWGTYLLKDTVILLIVASFYFMKIYSEKEKVYKDKKYFLKFLLESLKVVAIIEFINNAYTFPIAVELFIFMPILFLLLYSTHLPEQMKNTS